MNNEYSGKRVDTCSTARQHKQETAISITTTNKQEEHEIRSPVT